MAGVMRFLFALLLGFVLGVGGAVYLLTSGTGDLLIRKTATVEDLERRLRDAEQQRDSLGRQLEDVLARATRMEQSFGDLERRFRDISRGLDTPSPRAPEPPAVGVPAS
ncbi:MAG: hypothetical protein U0807_13390 [Candidatus Binatia bacterium]